MSKSDRPDAPKSPAAQALADLVARRKAAASSPKSGPDRGLRASEQAAAARSASKSRPAMRK